MVGVSFDGFEGVVKEEQEEGRVTWGILLGDGQDGVGG